MDSSTTRPLNITVVGAGIGGLAAAIALRRSGNRVKIFESSPHNTEFGAGISLQNNSLRILNAWGFLRENLNSVSFDGINIRDAVTGEGHSVTFPHLEQAKAKAINALTCQRNDLLEELKRLAVGDNDCPGPPAELYFDSKVVSCDTEAGSITLESGEAVAADLVIGADGIHSTIRPSILGESVTADTTGLSCFRCLLDATKVADHPTLSWLNEGIEAPWNITTVEGSHFSSFMVYFVRKRELLNLVAYYHDRHREGKCPFDRRGRGASNESRYPGSFSYFSAEFETLLDLPTVPTTASPTGILRWQLPAMPLLSTWVKGRAMIMGDAAHSTLPTSGRAGIAIEEAVTLGVLFPLGTTGDEVSERLEAFQELCKGRGDLVNSESVARVDSTQKKTMSDRELQVYLVARDAIKTAEEYSRLHFDAAPSHGDVD
ncbi:FAD/NAD(P)-binding domain-containing protein [Mycena chlorophos]|uniref:FAD/NAD(P)-binding domain-containing protein n=1 Tax=Mycena chlorophos TaxID=658473 RepID=A0A8H6VTW0_MYCCL|nr:FAD/NAD(P)-binding domain-containing protein [Mycena chlorophos]